MPCQWVCQLPCVTPVPSSCCTLSARTLRVCTLIASIIHGSWCMLTASVSGCMILLYLVYSAVACRSSYYFKGIMYVHFSVPPGATTQVAQSIIQECLESLPEADCASIMKQYKVTMVTLTVHVSIGQEVRSTTLLITSILPWQHTPSCFPVAFWLVENNYVSSFG